MNFTQEEIDEMFKNGDIVISQKIHLEGRIKDPTMGDTHGTIQGTRSSNKRDNENSLQDFIIMAIKDSNKDYLEIATYIKSIGYEFINYDEDMYTYANIEASRITSTVKMMFDEKKLSRVKGPEGRYIYETYSAV